MIKADDVSVIFSKGMARKKLKALDGFSLSVEEGDVFALLGPNGAGKSTAMYCFLGLIQPNYGSISVLGRRPSPGSPLLGNIAYLPEEPQYHLYLTVEEAVTYYAGLYGAAANRQKVAAAIERVGMSEFRDMRLSKCSKGMKQKVGIAQCLINTPTLVFLDEPTRGLDPLTVKEFRDILVEMNNRGATIIVNSHMLSEIEMICNRVAIMNKGRVVVQDELNNLRDLNVETYSVEFGTPETVPDYVAIMSKTDEKTNGEIPTEKLAEFVRFIEEGGLKLYECSLKRKTLEEAFFNILKEDA